MKKKIISLLLAVVMIVGLIPLSAFAAISPETGVPELVLDGSGIYHIANSDDWVKFGNMVTAGNTFADKTVVLDNDIAVSTLVGDWDAKKAFSGTFEGNGNTVTFTNTESTSNKGVFNYTVGAKISNLIVCGEISGVWSLGGVVGCANSTEITYCENHAQITSIAQNDEAYAGGIVGVSEGNVTISDCKNFGNVSGNYSVGGIIGETRANDIVKNCINSAAEVFGNKNNVGGIVGNAASSATILNCINESAVSGNKYIGGIVGHTGENQVVVENCINYGSVTTIDEYYTVSFNIMSHGTNIPAQTVLLGGKVKRPTDPAAEGYTFSGWFKDETCTEEWNFATDTVTANITLYAKWTPDMSKIEDGYYLVGTLNGENFWDMSSLTSDMKLEPSETFGEYTLDWTFYLNDEIKVVKIEDGKITAWYNDGGEYYKIGESNAGEGTLYFRPEGNAEWSYFFLIVPAKTTPIDPPSEFDFSAYCLCGYINGADYGMTEQSNPKWNEPGEYVFGKDGTLTVTFTEDSYVQVKTLHGEYRYAFEKYVEDGTPTRLYEANDTSYKEKMFVPAETQVTFTLSKDMAGELVLGYTEGDIASYYVFFDMMGHGGSIANQIIKKGGKITKPADPVADGYTFGGWYKEAQCNNLWNFDTDTVTANTTLYAKWTENKSLADGYYLVGTLNGENFGDVSSLTSGMKLEPSGTDDEYKLDWTFYEDDRVKVVKVKDGVITAWYNDGGEYYKIGKSEAGEGTLYFRTEGNAEWSYFFLTVTPKTTPIDPPSPPSGFDFSAYCLCGYINGVDYGNGLNSHPYWNEPGEYVFSKDGTLIATFTKDSYVQVKTVDGKYWYVFEKYVEDGTATRLYEEDAYNGEMFVPAGTQVTFTLSKDTSGAFVLGYQIDAYTVSFNIMGHGIGIPSQTVVSGEKVQKPADPVADGYKFGGWYKDETCTEEWNFDTDTVTGDITLYAKWKVFATPTADDFNFVPPNDCVYDGQPKQASIYTVKEGMGVITLKYQKYNGIGWDTATTDAPTEIGKYRVVVSVEEGANYAASAADITSESWVFEITAPACEHEHATVSYVWGTDPRSCTASLICDDCHAVLESETLSWMDISTRTVSATKCTERSYVYFVAEFESETFGSTESEKEYFDIGPHSYVDYVCEYCHVAEDLEGAMQDATNAIKTVVKFSTDAAVAFLGDAAITAIEHCTTVADILQAKDYWITAINKQLGGEAHEHTFSTDWNFDETKHWHESTCGHDVISGFGAHTFGDGVVNGNLTIYTCSECGYFKVIYNTAGDNEGEIISGVSYTGISLTLGSDIAINFYMDLTEEARQNGTMTFDIGGRIVTVDGKDAKYNSTEKKYYFSTPLTALEMAETVKATFTYNGVEYVQEYSAQKYIDKIVGDEKKYGKEAAALARKIANYGHYAQIYLESIHTNVHIVDSGDGYDRMDKFENVDIDTQAAIEALAKYSVKVTGTSENLSLYGSTVYFDSATALNYYVTVKDGKKPTATAVNTVTGKSKDVEIKLYKDKIYIVSVKDITATELADDITVTVNGEITLTGSVFAYCNSVVQAHSFYGATAKDTFAVNAMAAFYEYYTAAMEYISFELHFDIPEKYKVFTADGEEITGEKTVKCYRTFSFRLVPDENYKISRVISGWDIEPDENGLYTVSYVGGKHNIAVYTKIDSYCLTVKVEGEDASEMWDTTVSFEYGSHETVVARNQGSGTYTLDIPKGLSGTIVIKKSGYQEYRQEFTADGTVEEITVNLTPNN